MASTDNEVPAPIIVKKIKKGGGGHHGGAWKVAYADFVTAMMAFFLLMWLLNATTQEAKEAISSYFDPSNPMVAKRESGAGGVLSGLSMSADGAMVSDMQDPVAPPNPRPTMQGDEIGEMEYRPGLSDDQESASTMQSNPTEGTPTEEAFQITDTTTTSMSDGQNILDDINEKNENTSEEMEGKTGESEEKAEETFQKIDIESLKAELEEKEDQLFEAIKEKIEQEIRETPELAELQDNLLIDITPEGLRIQIIDAEGRSMFPIGKANMFDFMRNILGKVTQAIIPQPNQISIRGHTDGKPYPPGSTYTNWNLSSDRALASRSAMIQFGLETDRIENVVGKADREHLLPEEPLSERNRRISIILLRQLLNNPTDIERAMQEAVKNREETIASTGEETSIPVPVTPSTETQTTQNSERPEFPSHQPTQNRFNDDLEFEPSQNIPDTEQPAEEKPVEEDIITEDMEDIPDLDRTVQDKKQSFEFDRAAPNVNDTAPQQQPVETITPEQPTESQPQVLEFP